MAPIIQECDDDVCVTGMSGSFPGTDGVQQFKENLLNKVDMLTEDGARWKSKNPELPKRHGTVKNLEKFDSTFFKIHYKQAEAMDPLGRVLLERVYEAIIDAGVNPKSLRDTNTGVFVGACVSETEISFLTQKTGINGYLLVGTSRSLLANRVSHWLGTTGPSFIVDCACSSGLHAFYCAYNAIQSGACDSAIVGGSSLTLLPTVSLQFSKLGVLAPDGFCKPFEKEGGGYMRSEAIVAMFLQKRKDSKRIYTHVLQIGINNDGNKIEGVTYPSKHGQMRLYKQIYDAPTAKVLPTDLEYIEGHATGTVVGDPEEVEGIDTFFCKDRKDPLKIGSVKSNMGHCEAVSGLASVVKACIAYETGIIPATLHYKTPRDSLKGIIEGRLEVVTESTPWNRGIMGVNCFGFGGSNAHVALGPFNKKKINGGLPNDNLPRLVCVSGRTEASVNRILDDAESRPVDVEYVGLLHNIHESDITGHIYRGYTILRPNNVSIQANRSVKHSAFSKRPICFVFSGMGSQWPGAAGHLMELPIFAAAIEKCHQVLLPKGMDLKRILTDPDPKLLDCVVSIFVSITCVQIGLCDVITALGIVPDYILGHSMGELASSYMDGSATLEQTVLMSYYRGLVSVEMPFIKGSMAAIGMGYAKIKNLCPPDIEVACHNAPDSSTISGPAASITKFVKQLTDKGIFAKEVASANIAYHSKYIAEGGALFIKYLKDVVKEPKKRGSKWICSSLPPEKWDTPEAQYSSAEYHVNNLINPVFFEEAARMIPSNAINIEIAPHGLLIPILNRSHKTCTNVPLTRRHSKNTTEFLLSALGQLYELGLNPKLHELYPSVEFPVSNCTPFLAHLVEWDHSDDWPVVKYEVEKLDSSERNVITSLGDYGMEFLAGHNIDGRVLYPATGYLYLAWETMSQMAGRFVEETSVVFEDVRFLRASNMSADESFEFTVVIPAKTGYFEIIEGNTAIVTGYVHILTDASKEFKPLPEPCDESAPDAWKLSTKDIYKEFRLRGYNYSGMFRGIQWSNLEGTSGCISWENNNWISFLDTIMQFKLISYDTRGLFVPTRVVRMTIDIKRHYEAMNKLKLEGNRKAVPITYYKDVDIVRTSGVEIRSMHAIEINKRRPLGIPVVEKYQFVPNFSDQHLKMEDAVRINIQLLVENLHAYNLKGLEIFDPPKNVMLQPLMPMVRDALGDLPLIQTELSVLTDTDIDLGGNITIIKKIPINETNNAIVIGSNLLQKPHELSDILTSMREKGIILSREKVNVRLEEYYQNVDIITVYRIKDEKLVMLMKRSLTSNMTFLPISGINDQFGFVEEIKSTIKKITDEDKNGKLVLVAQNDETSGIIGFTNCLRREIGYDMIKCLYICDNQAPPFDPDLPFYQLHLDKDLGINVYKNGVWGTYRHLLIDMQDDKPVEHAYYDILQKGDLSTLSWLEGPIHPATDEHLVHVYYASLNYKDVVTATGHVHSGMTNNKRTDLLCSQGLELSGRTNNGGRIMAVVWGMGIANVVKINPSFAWPVPNHWSLEDAATVPVVYMTVITGLMIQSKLKRGSSILIHAGMGGVGQACINYCLHHGCEVFTTVGSQEKKDMLKKIFPQIRDDHIGSTRDTSFEDMIFVRTKGKGVDIIFNSLADDKLQASMRCLATKGTFIEIGKYDIIKNSLIGMYQFSKGVTVIGLMNFDEMNADEMNQLHYHMVEGIRNGAVKPICRHVFGVEDVEESFKYIAASKHKGKVVIKMRDEETTQVVPTLKLMKAHPTFKGHKDFSYVVVGGLGGFGLEMIDWMILKGARNIVISSRKGIKNGYQSYRTSLWKSYGVQIVISTEDVSTLNGCKKLLQLANNLAPVAGIFNLAVILKDAMLENQTPQMFAEVFKPKVNVTKYLDEESRKLCPHLQHFVVFSSVACGLGNAGQTNYGMANSVMERICEIRKADGLPALAIEWGAVGDVGLVADMQEEHRELEIGGTLQQKILCCLSVLNDLMTCTNSTVVSSMVVAEKRIGESDSKTVVGVFTRIMNIKDVKKLSPEMSVSELGMDSIMGVEIKQSLERDFEIFLTPGEIKRLTLAEIQALSEKYQNSITEAPKIPRDTKLDVIMKSIKNEALASSDVVSMTTINEYQKSDTLVFMIPGMEGCCDVFETMCKRLKCRVNVLQYGFNYPNESIHEMAQRFAKLMKPELEESAHFILVGYSLGGLVAMEIAKIFESKGYTGNLILIDSSPEYVPKLMLSTLGDMSETRIDTMVLTQLFALIDPNTDVLPEILERGTWAEKIKTMSACPALPGKYPKSYLISLVEAIRGRLVAIKRHVPTEAKIKSPLVLLRAKEIDPDMDVDEFYGLKKMAERPVVMHLLEGTHATILENRDCPNIVNKLIAYV